MTRGRYYPDEVGVEVLRQAGATLVRWSAPRAPHIFDELRASFRAQVPHARWTPAERAWTVPPHGRADLEEWLSLFDPACIMRDGARQSRAGATDHGQAVTTLDDAYRALFLVPQAPLWAAEAVFRAAVKHAHPDTGTGSHEAAKAVNAAITTIRAHQQRRAS